MERIDSVLHSKNADSTLAADDIYVPARAIKFDRPMMLIKLLPDLLQVMAICWSGSSVRAVEHYQSPCV
jgi:hypothetical protein